MKSYIKLILLLTVFLLPLIGVTKELGYEQVKVLFFFICTTLVGFLWILTRSPVRWTAVKTASILFILSLLFTSLTGIDPPKSLLGTQPYFQGWILYAYLFLFAFLVSQSKISLQTWVGILSGSASLVAFVAIRQWIEIDLFHQNLPTYAGRVVSTFGQPNFYSGWLVFFLPFLFFLKFKSKWDFPLRFLMLVTLVLAIIISESKTAYFCTGLIAFVLLVKELKNPLRKIVFGLSVIGLVVILWLSFRFDSGIYQYQIDQTPTKEGHYTNYSPEKRVYIWPVVLDLIRQKPIFGYGLENLSSVFGSNLKPEIPGNFPTHALVDVKNLVVDRSHNYILDLALFSGCLGLLLWLILVGFCLNKVRISFLIFPLLIYLIWIQFQNQSVVHLVYFWLIVGLIDQEPKLAYIYPQYK